MRPDPLVPDSCLPRRRRGQQALGSGAQTSGIAAHYYDSPDWWQLRAAMVAALQNFPEARDALVRALQSRGAAKEDSDAAA